MLNQVSRANDVILTNAMWKQLQNNVFLSSKKQTFKKFLFFFNFRFQKSNRPWNSMLNLVSRDEIKFLVKYSKNIEYVQSNRATKNTFKRNAII